MLSFGDSKQELLGEVFLKDMEIGRMSTEDLADGLRLYSAAGVETGKGSVGS